jgi:O-antigen/teichoic acid export membrane protein
MTTESDDTLEQAAKAEQENVRSVAREGGWAGIFTLLGAAIRYGNIAILTRVLGAELYGLYALANTVVTILAVPASLGMPSSVVHYVASYAQTEQWAKLRWTIRSALRAVYVASIVGAGLLVAVSPFMSHVIFHKKGLVLPLVGLALALPFLALYSVYSGGLQGLKHIRAKVFIERIAHPLIFSVLLLVGGFYYHSLEYALACFFVAAGLVYALGMHWLRKNLRAVPKVEPAPPEWRKLLSFSIPVLFLRLLNFLIAQSDIIVMGIFRPAAEVGVYTIASRLAAAVGMSTDSLGASLAPSFAGLSGKQDTEALRRLFHTSTRWICLLGTFVGLTLLLGGPSILGVFGRAFRGGYPVLCLLVAGQMFGATFGANGMLITMSGHPRVNLFNAAVFGTGNLALMFYLIPRYGALGAAAATAGFTVILNIARGTEVWLFLRIGPWDRTIPKALVALLLAAAAGGAALHWIHPVAGAAAGIVTYLLAWRLLGPEPEDWDMVKRAWTRARQVIK